jgi:hypothetical protein
MSRIFVVAPAVNDDSYLPMLGWLTESRQGRKNYLDLHLSCIGLQSTMAGRLNASSRARR